jgi:hypothetical protein
MPKPEDFDPEHNPIHWPAILAVFAVQMIVLIAGSIAVINHSSATASSPDHVWMTGWRLTSSMPAMMRSLSSCFEVTRM